MQSIEQAGEFLYQSLINSETMEDDLIKLVLSFDSNHRQAIRKYYEAKSNPNGLPEDLKKKLTLNFRDVITHMFTSPVEYDAFELKRAIKGFSTDEECIYEIISNRPYWMLQEIKKKYLEMYNKTLETDLEKTFNKQIYKNLLMLLNTERRVNPNPDKTKCQNDAKTLYSVTNEEMWGTDENIFRNIFVLSSPEELVLTLRYFYKKTGTHFLQAVEDNMTSKMRIFFKELLFNVIVPAEIAAEKIRKSVKGIGTDTNLLERILITRNELDMDAVRDFYYDKYNVDIQKDIEGDTSGSYQKLLLGLVNK